MQKKPYILEREERLILEYEYREHEIARLTDAIKQLTYDDLSWDLDTLDRLKAKLDEHNRLFQKCKKKLDEAREDYKNTEAYFYEHFMRERASE